MRSRQDEPEEASLPGFSAREPLQAGFTLWAARSPPFCKHQRARLGAPAGSYAAFLYLAVRWRRTSALPRNRRHAVRLCQCPVELFARPRFPRTRPTTAMMSRSALMPPSVVPVYRDLTARRNSIRRPATRPAVRCSSDGTIPRRHLSIYHQAVRGVMRWLLRRSASTGSTGLACAHTIIDRVLALATT